MGDQTSNLNPTREARLAMLVWGVEYPHSRLGSMDFFDRLSNMQQKQVSKWVEQLDLSPCKENDDAHVIRLLVAGGLVTEEKVQQARDLLSTIDEG